LKVKRGICKREHGVRRRHTGRGEERGDGGETRNNFVSRWFPRFIFKRISCNVFGSCSVCVFVLHSTLFARGPSLQCIVFPAPCICTFIFTHTHVYQRISIGHRKHDSLHIKCHIYVFAPVYHVSRALYMHIYIYTHTRISAYLYRAQKTRYSVFCMSYICVRSSVSCFPCPVHAHLYLHTHTYI